MIDSEPHSSIAWRMLSSRAQQYERIPGSFGSLRPEHIAAMLEGLSDEAYATGLLCEAGQWTSLPRVASYLYCETLDLSEQEQWDLPRGVGQVKNLVYLALIEATGRSVDCVVCSGTGSCSDVAGRKSTCELCLGRGRLPVIQQTRAHIIGVNESNWKRTWRDRFHRSDEILQGWLSDARKHLEEALAGRPHRLRAGRKRIA